MSENVNVLIGKTIKEITGAEKGSDSILFKLDTGEKYRMYHSQDCCESVEVDDVDGDIADLIGSPLVVAEEVSSEGAPQKEEWYDSFTWTFYKFATVKGFVMIKWYGTSNGYYSESVDFEKIGG